MAPSPASKGAPRNVVTSRGKRWIVGKASAAGGRNARGVCLPPGSSVAPDETPVGVRDRSQLDERLEGEGVGLLVQILSFVADVAGTYVAQLIVNNGVTASNPATATISASGGGAPGGSGLIVPPSVTVPVGQTVPYSVTVGAPAPDWLFVTVTSSDPSIVTVFPASMLIPEGAMAPVRSFTITGVANGSATITAVIYGMASASGSVQVGSGGGGGGGGATSMSFSPASLTFNNLGTQNLTLTLNAPAPSGGLTVSVRSSNTGVATVPTSVSFGSNAASVPVPVSATGAGSATITASASGVSNASAGVNVSVAPPQPSINVSSSVTVTSGQSVAFPVTLSAPAPAGGVFVMLTSSDLSKATVTTSVLIAGGATAPNLQPLVSGISAGSATITATASGYTAGSGTVQVQAAGGGGGGGGFTYFSPGNVNLNQGTTQTISLNLSSPTSVPLTATLTSSNTSIFTVPSTVSFPSGYIYASLTVTAGSPGSATLTAAVPGYATISINVTVLPTSGVSVTWYGACWQTATIYGIHGDFQGMDLAISTPAPVTLNATLFFAPNCDASQGSDNMNDFGSTLGSGHTVQGFSHFPNVMPTSAMYWIGPLTADRKCPPGAPCSGCVNYTAMTPNCDLLP